MELDAAAVAAAGSAAAAVAAAESTVAVAAESSTTAAEYAVVKARYAARVDAVAPTVGPSTSDRGDYQANDDK